MPTGSPFNTTICGGAIFEVASPGVGLEKTFVLQQNFKNELLGISFDLVTDANAVNRFVWIEYVTNTITFCAGSPSFAHTASSTYYYTCFPAASLAPAAPGPYVPFPILPFIHFDETDQVIIHVDGIQVGDQLDNIRCAVNTWIHPH